LQPDQTEYRRNPFTELIKINRRNPADPIAAEPANYAEKLRQIGLAKLDAPTVHKLAQLPYSLIDSELQRESQLKIFKSKIVQDKRQWLIAQATERKLPVKRLAGFKSTALTRKAHGKTITQNYIYKLLAGNPLSPLRNSYLNSLSCQSRLIQVNGRICTTYCNYRWCSNCNRIRTAKLINNYSDELRIFIEPQFVTLTPPNCHAEELRKTIKKMQEQLKLIFRDAKERKGFKIKAFRKIEVTVNMSRKKAGETEMHPHFHLIVQGRALAEFIKNQWLKRMPDTDEKGQKIVAAGAGYEKELFKYFTKMSASKSKTNKLDYIEVDSLDAVFQAMTRLRVFQPIGFKKVAEELNPYELQRQQYDLPEPEQDQVYTWCPYRCNYFNSNNKPIDRFSPSPKLAASLKKIVVNWQLINDT
jgi:diadenosine tetraphosphate (Ap4A) HIT family hydrolase